MSGTRVHGPPTLRHRWPWWRRWFREFIWFFDLDDGTGDGSPSLTKWLAFLGGNGALVAIFASVEVTNGQLVLYIIALAAAFGRPIFKRLLERMSFGFGLTSNDSRTRTESVSRSVTHQIQERREAGKEDGTEPT